MTRWWFHGTGMSVPDLPRSSALSLTERAHDAVLPKRAMWFFVVAPPFLAFLFDPQCSKDGGHLLRALLTLTLYTVCTGVAVHYAFDWLYRRTLGLGLWLRVPMLLSSNVAVVVVVTLLQLPLIAVLYPEADGEKTTILGRAVLVSFGYLGFATFIGYLQSEASRERLRAHEERASALEARLAALQAQLQPHFLFNSLNVCAGLAHENPDLAEETLDRLAGFLRYALESTERKLVPLEDELEAVRSYLEVQRQRFGDRLTYSVESDAQDCTVPPLLLQPLVENAVLHGIRKSGGTVRVRATQSARALTLVVEDDGVGEGRSSHVGTGLGQRSVRERLRLLYGEHARVQLGGGQHGYRCELTLPVAP